MKFSAKQIVGIFDSLDSLYAFLDDRFIYLRNNESCREVYLLFDHIQKKKQGIKFLSANNYSVKDKSSNKLKVGLSNYKNNSNRIYVFLINTKFGEDEISNTVNDLIINMSSNVSDLHFYFLNSDSFFGYYKQYEKNKNTDVIGSPSVPTKMNSPNKKPF